MTRNKKRARHRRTEAMSPKKDLDDKVVTMLTTDFEPEWAKAMRYSYARCHEFFPELNPVALTFIKSSKDTLEQVMVVINTTLAVSAVLSAVGPSVVVAGPLTAALVPLSVATSHIYNKFSKEFHVIDELNKHLNVFNEAWKSKIPELSGKFNQDMQALYEKYKDRVDSKEYRLYAERLCDEHLTSVTSFYQANLRKTKDNTMMSLRKSYNEDAMSVVEAILDAAISAAPIEKLDIDKLVKKAIATEKQKMQINSRASAVVSKLKRDGSKIDKELLEKKCTSEEITLLMIAVKESELERKENIPLEYRHFMEFSDPFFSLQDLEEVRKKNVKSFALESGAFSDLIKKRHPKALARMLSTDQHKEDKVIPSVANGNLDDKVKMLTMLPLDMWKCVEDVGRAIDDRSHISESSGISTRAKRCFLDAINKLYNILSNFIGRGIKDEALVNASKDLGDKLNAYDGTMIDRRRDVVDNGLESQARAITSSMSPYIATKKTQCDHSSSSRSKKHQAPSLLLNS